MPDRNLTTFRRYYEHCTEEGMFLRIPPSDAFEMASVPARVNPYRITSTQEFPLGTELFYAERKFRYALAGATNIAVGRLCQSVVPLAGHIDEVVNSPAADATTIAFTPAVASTDDLAANELADGYIHINDDTGEGHMYRIKSHPAITGATSGTLTLYDPIVLALGDDATATVYHNTWRSVIIHPSPPTAPVVGVTVIAVTASNYCWLQVKGPCAVLTDGTLVVGAGVMPSDGTDGAVEAWVPETDTAGEVETMPVGICAAVNATTEFSNILLDIPGM